MSGRRLEGLSSSEFYRKPKTKDPAPTESQAARRRRLAKAEAIPLAGLSLDRLGRPPYISRRNEFRTYYQAFMTARRVNEQAIAQVPHEPAWVAGASTLSVAPLFTLQAQPTPQQEHMVQIEDAEAAVLVGPSLSSTPLLQQSVENVVDGNVESVKGSTRYSWSNEYEGSSVSNDAAAAEDEREDHPRRHSATFGAHAHDDSGTLATQDTVLRSVAERNSTPGSNAKEDGLSDAKEKNDPAGAVRASSASTTPPQVRLSDMKGKGRAVPCHVADALYVAPNLPNQVNLASGTSRSPSPVLGNGDQQPEGSDTHSHSKSSNIAELEIIGDTVVAILRSEGESWTSHETLLAKMTSFNPRWSQRAVIRAVKDLDCLQWRVTSGGQFYRYIENNDSYRQRRLTRYVNIMNKLSILQQ